MASHHRQAVPSYLFARDETERRFIVRLYRPQFIAELNNEGQIINYVLLEDSDFADECASKGTTTDRAIQLPLERALEWYRETAPTMRKPTASIPATGTPATAPPAGESAPAPTPPASGLYH